MSFLPYASTSGWAGWGAAMGLSAMAHGAMALALISDLGEFAQDDTPSERRPSFTITLDRLDSDTLAGIEERDGIAGADSETPSDTESPAAQTDPDSETVTPALPETDPAEEETEIAGLTPDAVEPVEPETITPEAVEPDVVEPETVEAIEPDSIAPTTDSATAAALAEAAATLTPEVVEANPLLSDTLSSTGAATSTAMMQVPADTTITAIQPSPNNPATQTVSVGQERLAALSAETGAAPPAPANTLPPPKPASEQDLAIGDLIRRIRAADLEDCLLALPRRDGEDGVGLALIAAEDGTISRFVSNTLTSDDADIRQTRTLIDPRQCPSLSFVRQNADYPATRLGLRIDTPEVNSGDRLTGVVRGVGGRYVTLLLVDTNGVVHDLQRFLSFSGNFARFDAPVNLVGQARDSSQILIVLGTQRPPSRIKDNAGLLARDVFVGLEDSPASTAALAISTFDIR